MAFGMGFRLHGCSQSGTSPIDAGSICNCFIASGALELFSRPLIVVRKLGASAYGRVVSVAKMKFWVPLPSCLGNAGPSTPNTLTAMPRYVETLSE